MCVFYLDSEKGKLPKRTGRKATDLKLGVGLRCVGCRARIAGLPKSRNLVVISLCGSAFCSEYEARLSV